MEIFERYKKNRTENNHEEVVRNSQRLFQLKEYNGEIWFTYENELVCPCSMLKDEPVNAVCEMRKLYIERTPKLQRL
jgi:hypothetical protein